MINYLRQGGYDFFIVCLSVCLLANLRKNFQTDLREIFSKGCNGPMNKWLNFGGDLEPIREMAGLILRQW